MEKKGLNSASGSFIKLDHGELMSDVFDSELGVKLSRSRWCLQHEIFVIGLCLWVFNVFDWLLKEGESRAIATEYNFSAATIRLRKRKELEIP
ncbi:hypothetical protein N7478_002426 [Penicillium angulare]|uniref:uncharacterized protein n=1 Tax=Penicillium angulare TaxID=116970 RepID=UPI0025425309|nr:uncharacterized protein N7478_002426 [Penicillium angulare]KAJ5286740.1 hypothetical protein N7478_002426 [Penicillium angulare]